jgi:hypothetical protein
MWRRRDWRLLQGMIDRLPRNSYYKSALALDEDYQQMLMEYEEQHGAGSTPEWAPPLTTYTAEVEMLRDVVNELRTLVHVQLAAGGGKPGKPQYVPPPTTAAKRVAWKQRERKHKALAARLLPHKRAQLLEELADGE